MSSFWGKSENELSKITQLFSRIINIRIWVYNSAQAYPTFRNWIQFTSTETQSCSTKEVKGITFSLNSPTLSTQHSGKPDDSFLTPYDFNLNWIHGNNKCKMLYSRNLIEGGH